MHASTQPLALSLLAYLRGVQQITDLPVRHPSMCQVQMSTCLSLTSTVFVFRSSCKLRRFRSYVV